MFADDCGRDISAWSHEAATRLARAMGSGLAAPAQGGRTGHGQSGRHGRELVGITALAEREQVFGATRVEGEPGQ